MLMCGRPRFLLDILFLYWQKENLLQNWLRVRAYYPHHETFIKIWWGLTWLQTKINEELIEVTRLTYN